MRESRGGWGAGNICVCGRPAEKPLPEGIDGLFARCRAYEKVCEECYRRIRRLRSRFRPGFGCIAVTVVYDPESRLFTIGAFNEYGDSAYLSEDMRGPGASLVISGLGRG